MRSCASYGLEHRTARQRDSEEHGLRNSKLSHTAALILQSIDNGCSYGFDIMELTGLPSATVYPALRRMEREGLISSQWEAGKKAQADQRPPRKYYRVTRVGTHVLEHSQRRYPLLGKLAAAKRWSQTRRSSDLSYERHTS
jgi:PadR family transcriptional regulator, regulatory protein PadR